MSLSKLIHFLRNFMSGNKLGRSRKLFTDGLRVELIPVPSSAEDGRLRRAAVSKILGLMYLNLGKRGRPRKKPEGESDVA
jgi:hypothetical protein